jgi:alkylation response protein AidB-like acyl-CoA dehydrogenase
VSLGRLAAKIYGARAALVSAARVWERGDFAYAELESLQAHHLCRRAGLEVTMDAFDICGARAAFRHFPLDIMLRDTRTFTLHDRDELFMQQVGRGLVEESFAAKGYADHVQGA